MKLAKFQRETATKQPKNSLKLLKLDNHSGRLMKLARQVDKTSQNTKNNQKPPKKQEEIAEI